jgi:dimethylamine--corrinoid protein Co-methyltransferase
VGVGDPFGMAITHALASGMGGIRTAGDLVARVQMSRGLKTEAAKEYVAGKLGIGVLDLANEEVMTEVRRELDLGLVYSLPGYARGLEAKRNIAGVLEIPVNCLRRLGKGT